jgi:hypothetical protein
VPPLTRWFIKTAIVYLVAALLLGALPAGRTVLGIPAFALRPVQVHLLTVGWITQMIFGVAHWMFPRASKERPRGSESAILAVYILLNCGLLLRAVSEPIVALAGGRVWDWLLVLSAGLQWMAGIVFALHIWGRVKEK